ncbi:hypothetical protein TIFTF001_006792 [Ficus carica]|uniref:Uncharacterized protein n=1 Tax=Ficus carica TaxID=3494 RepID=A0AA87ZQ32_FICCA|nr:hypothetical protein TIFTF001_006792 [Ficus carica]
MVLQVTSTNSTVESRKDPASEYWRTVMNDQAMPEAIHKLLGYNSDSAAKNSNGKTNGHGTPKSNTFADDFEQTPNVLSAYPNDDAKAAESAFVKG